MMVAEAVCALGGEQRRHVRAALYLVSALANNLPDSDIAYSWMDGPEPLGYLLHHRGHTHTVAFALPMAWLLGLAVWRWFSRRHADVGAPERRAIFGLALAGPLLHLVMDFGNSYGVHPFWPLTGRWFYGDTIFIVEPLWLAIAIPILSRALARRWLKLVLWVILVAALTAYWFLPFFPWSARLCLVGVVVVSLVVARQPSARVRVAYGAAGMLAVALVFACCAQLATRAVREAALSAFPALSVHDVVTTPLPGDPRCWDALLSGEQGGDYRVLRATVWLGSGSPEACRAGTDDEPTAPLARLDRPPRGGVRWRTEYRAPVSDLARLRNDDCRFAALLRFARLPYVSTSAKVAGDLRYDRSPGLDFSDLPLTAPPSQAGCPKLVPGWAEPRAELFQP